MLLAKFCDFCWPNRIKLWHQYWCSSNLTYSIQNIINLSIYLRSVENQKFSFLSKILKSTKSSSSKAWHFPPLLRHAESKPIIWGWSWMFVFYKTDVCQASFPFILSKKKLLSPSLIFALFGWKKQFCCNMILLKKRFSFIAETDHHIHAEAYTTY